MPRRWRIGRETVPDSAVVVARPTRYANPWSAGDVLHGAVLTAQDAVDAFEQALTQGRLQITVAEVRRVMFGQDVACYCPLETTPGVPYPCHGDVLMAIAAGLHWDDGDVRPGGGVPGRTSRPSATT